MTARRSQGTGSLFVKPGRSGREVWYGRFWVHGRRVKRRIGPKRAPGTSAGLTQRQAERELQRLIETENRIHPTETVSVKLAGERYLAHLRSLGRRRSTLMDYESYLRAHLVPFFAETPLEQIDEDDIDAFIAYERGEGKAPKSIRNWLGFLHSIFAYAEKRKWSQGNPCKLVDLPAVDGSDPDIRFLDQGELEAVLHALAEQHLAAQRERGGHHLAHLPAPLGDKPSREEALQDSVSHVAHNGEPNPRRRQQKQSSNGADADGGQLLFEDL